MRKLLGVLVACLSLAGCVDQQEVLAQQELAANKTKCAAVLHTLNSAVWHGKLGLTAAARTPAMMAIDAMPTDVEKLELQKLVGAEQGCQSDYMHWTAQYRTVYSAPQAHFYVAFDNILLDLMVGRISYGEANRKISTLDMQYRADITEAGLKEKQRQEHEATLAGISAAVEDNADATRSLAIPATPAAPAPMTFAPFPKQCHTVKSGNFFQTQCY